MRLDKAPITAEQRALMEEKNSVLLDPEELDAAIIGVTPEGNVQYSYSELVLVFASMHDCEDADAEEWVDYNTVRALAYMPEPRPEVLLV